MGPAATRHFDWTAVVDRGQASAGRDLPYSRQPNQSPVGLATERLLVAGVGGEGDLIVIAAAGQVFQRQLRIDTVVEPRLGGGRQRQDVQVECDADAAGARDVGQVRR